MIAMGKHEFKMLRKREGSLECDACEWRPPKAMRHTDRPRVMHAHHVIPRSCGGADTLENMILLCPNCHGLTHCLWRSAALPGWAPRKWHGPRTPHDLVVELRKVLDPFVAPSVVPQKYLALSDAT